MPKPRKHKGPLPVEARPITKMRLAAMANQARNHMTDHSDWPTKAELILELAEAHNTIAEIQAYVAETFGHWYKDSDSKVGKRLLFLSAARPDVEAQDHPINRWREQRCWGVELNGDEAPQVLDPTHFAQPAPAGKAGLEAFPTKPAQAKRKGGAK